MAEAGGRSRSTSKYEDPEWRIAQRTQPRRHPSTSSSDCSCSSCSDYQYRKRKIRRRERRKRRRARQEAAQSADDSGAEAAKRGVVSDRYGKYGILNESDKHAKALEFRTWLLEVKGRSYEALNMHEERNLFLDFIEDYNTATFPSKKYYDLITWEARMIKQKAPSNEPSSYHEAAFDDEKLRRQEMQRQRDMTKKKETEEALETLKKDRQVLDAMRRQKALRIEMDYLFKTGKVDKAREIQALLRATNKEGGEDVNEFGAPRDDSARGGGGDSD